MALSFWSVVIDLDRTVDRSDAAMDTIHSSRAIPQYVGEKDLWVVQTRLWK
jgi:hypothetical protein